MRATFYLTSLVLIVFWGLGAFVWNAGYTVYVLLELALISFIMGIIQRETYSQEK
jgi:hypothetical protein